MSSTLAYAESKIRKMLKKLNADNGNSTKKESNNILAKSINHSVNELRTGIINKSAEDNAKDDCSCNVNANLEEFEQMIEFFHAEIAKY